MRLSSAKGKLVPISSKDLLSRINSLRERTANRATLSRQIKPLSAAKLRKLLTNELKEQNGAGFTKPAPFTFILDLGLSQSLKPSVRKPYPTANRLRGRGHLSTPADGRSWGTGRRPPVETADQYLVARRQLHLRSSGSSWATHSPL